MAEHFPDEEATIVPAMEHVLTQSEENWFSKHGRAATPKGQLLTKGFDQAFLVAVLTSSRDSRAHARRPAAARPPAPMPQPFPPPRA
jgi:hypothetical protein